MDFAQVPPHSMDAEQACLGAVLMGDTEALDAIAEVLGPEDFYADRHRLVCKVMLALRPGTVDLITVTESLERSERLEQAGGREYLRELMESVYRVGGDTGAYARTVAHLAWCRRIQSRLLVLQRSLQTARPEDQAAISDQIAAAAQDLPTGSVTDLVHLGDAAEAELNALRQRQPGQILGSTWGFRSLDRATNGLQPSRLYIVAGATGMGKTALALNIVRRTARATQRPWLVVSYEMGNEDLARREIISMTGIDGGDYRRTALTQSQLAEVERIVGALKQIPVYVSDQCRTVADIRRRAAAIRRDSGDVGGILVDYLQLVVGRRSDSRTEEVSGISRDLKHLSIEAQCPVVAISNLSRKLEQRPNKRPMLSDLRESGQIEYDAEAVLFCYRDDYYDKDSRTPNVLEVIIAKQRDGPTETVGLYFDRARGRIGELAR